MAGTSWWCTSCSRVLRNRDTKHPTARDTVTAPKGTDKVTHDHCGGIVVLSQRLGLK